MRRESARLGVAVGLALVTSVACSHLPDRERASFEPKVDAPPEVRAPADSRTTHLVRPGDTVWVLARRYGVRPDTILEMNAIRDPRRLRVGAELVIPARGIQHRLARGETVWEIARSHKPCIESIVAVNQIGDVRRLRAGATLVIPAAGGCGRAAPAANPLAPKATESAEQVGVAAARHERGTPGRPNSPLEPPPESVHHGVDLEHADQALAEAERYLLEARFDQTLEMVERARRLLEAVPQGTDQAHRLARCEVLVATVHVAFAREEDARRSLALALERDPELQLDPALTSPKVLHLFEQARTREILVADTPW